MDAIAQVRVLASNYQAEYGRNGGGMVTVVSKTGTRRFHGSAYDYYRHEDLNANNFFSNSTLTPIAPYRYRMTGWSLGGPLLVPGKKTLRDKFFFFFSQELIGSRVNNATRFQTTPSAQERQGDFTQSYNVNGALIAVRRDAASEHDALATWLVIGGIAATLIAGAALAATVLARRLASPLEHLAKGAKPPA